MDYLQKERIINITEQVAHWSHKQSAVFAKEKSMESIKKFEHLWIKWVALEEAHVEN